MKRSPKPSVVLNKLHKGFVFVCIGLTLYGLSGLGMRWYRYFTVLRPEGKQRELMEKQQLLAEGSSDILIDSAQNLKM